MDMFKISKQDNAVKDASSPSSVRAGGQPEPLRIEPDQRTTLAWRQPIGATPGNPTDKQDSFAKAVGDYWGTLVSKTVQNSAEWGGTDGNDPC